MAKIAQATVFLNANIGDFQKKMRQGQREFGKAVGNIGKMASRAGKSMMKIGAAAGAGFLLAANEAKKFNQSMREVNTLINLSEGEFTELKKEVREVARTLGIDVNEAAAAAYQAISAGVPKDNVIDFLKIGAKAAIGGVTDVKTAVDGLTTVLNAFKIPASQAERVADMMFATVKRGKTTMEELSQSLFNAAPIAAAAGISFEEVAGHIATLTKQGTPTRVATTQIRAAIQSLIKPNENMSDALLKSSEALISQGIVTGDVVVRHRQLKNSLSLVISQYQSGAIKESEYKSRLKEINKAMRENAKDMGAALLKSKGLAGAFSLLNSELSPTKNEMAEMVGSVEGLQSVLGTTGENAKTLAEDVKEISGAVGDSNQAFTEMNKDRQVELLVAQLKDLGLAIGESVLPMLKQVTALITPIVGQMGKWAESHPKVFQGLAGLSAVLLGAGGLLFAFGQLIFAGVQVAAFFKAWPAVVDAAKFAFTGFIGPIAAAVAVGGAAWMLTRWLDNTLDQFKLYREGMDGFFDFIVGGINKIKELLGLTREAASLGTRTQQLINSGQLKLGGNSISQNASGTRSFRGGLTMVGERGMELMRVPRGTEILSNDRTEGLLHRISEGIGNMSTPRQLAPMTFNFFNTPDSFTERGALEVMEKARRAQMRFA